MLAASAALPVGGGFTAFHLLSACLMPIVTMWHWRRPSKALVMLFGSYLAAQVLSDVAHGTHPLSTVAEIFYLSVFALPALTVPWLVADDILRWQRATVVSMVALAALGILYSSAVDARTVWKFGLGAPLLVFLTVLLGLLWVRGRRTAVPAVVAMVGMTSLYLGFRSLAAEALLSSVVLLGLIFWQPTRRALLGLFVLTIVSLFTIQSVYVWAADSGRLGYEEQIRYQRQAATDGGLLLTNRPEVEISTMLIRKHPILGLGSEPYLDDSEKVEGRDRLRSLKIGFTSYIRERMLGEFQAHSMFFTAWVRAGILAAVSVLGLWLWMVVHSLRLVMNQSLDGRLLPFLVCAIPTLTWELLFSPTSVGAGIIYGLVVSTILLHRARPTVIAT